MAYVCELGTSQRVYLDNQGMQTLTTLISSQPGQQQQASNSFSTGNWTAIPEVYHLGHQVIIKLYTTGGDRFIQIQGNSLSILNNSPHLNSAQALPLEQVDFPGNPGIQPMQPLKPMQPMTLKMGDMQMSMNPMEMRMGNLSMQSNPQTPSHPKFCSQCGTPVQADDHFCSNCGHRLS